MEIFFALLLLLTMKNHANGFSHFGRKGWKKLFFVAEDEEAELYINGFCTGLLGTQSLYFPAQQREIEVEVRKQGELLDYKSLILDQPRSFYIPSYFSQEMLRKN